MIKEFVPGKTYVLLSSSDPEEVSPEWFGCKMRVDKVKSTGNGKVNILGTLLNLGELRARSNNKDIFDRVPSYVDWSENLEWWGEVEIECPHCKKVVEPDILGLCPECTWNLMEVFNG